MDRITKASVTLAYSTPAESSGQLQIRESDGTIHIDFGVWPMWVHAVGLGLLASAAALSVFLLLLNFKVTLWLLQLGPEIANIVLFAVLSQFAAIAFYGAVAVGHGYQLYRFGRVARTLTATASGLTRTRMGWYAPHQRFLPADQITEVELLQLTDIFSREQHVALLTIRRRGKWFGLR